MKLITASAEDATLKQAISLFKGDIAELVRLGDAPSYIEARRRQLVMIDQDSSDDSTDDDDEVVVVSQ
jgi:hypothetical protein